MYDFVEHGWGLTWSIVYSSVLTSEKETWNSWSESSKAQLKWLWNWSISPVKKCWRNWDYSVWKRESSGHKEDGLDSSLWAQRKFWLNVMKSSLLWGWLRWKGLLRESVESTSLEIFKSCLDTVLSSVVQRILLDQGGWTRLSPEDCSVLNYSVILWHLTCCHPALSQGVWDPHNSCAISAYKLQLCLVPQSISKGIRNLCLGSWVFP